MSEEDRRVVFRGIRGACAEELFPQQMAVEPGQQRCWWSIGKRKQGRERGRKLKKQVWVEVHSRFILESK